MVFQSCLTARTEPDRGIGGLCELDFLGVGELPVMDDLEPPEKTDPPGELSCGVHDHTSQSMPTLSPSSCVCRSNNSGGRIHRYAREWLPHTCP